MIRCDVENALPLLRTAAWVGRQFCALAQGCANTRSNTDTGYRGRFRCACWGVVFVAVSALMSEADADDLTDYGVAIDRLKSAIRYEVEQKKLPAFSISLVDHNRVVWADGFGFQDSEQRVSASAGTVYRVGSV